MFSRLKQQLRTGTLLEVGEAAADKLEWRCLHVRQVESEREFTLKPRFNRMPVGRHHVNWISACQRGNMQICEFTQGLLTTPVLQPNRGGNQHQHKRGRYGQGWRPSPRPPWTLCCIDAFGNFQAKLRPRREPAPASLSHSLQLQTAERVCGAGRTRSQVRFYFRQLAAKKLAIHVKVEFWNPIASHLKAPRRFS